jgi:hypothetical protein
MASRQSDNANGAVVYSIMCMHLVLFMQDCITVLATVVLYIYVYIYIYVHTYIHTEFVSTGQSALSD